MGHLKLAFRKPFINGCGIDILLSSYGPRAMKVNSPPGLECTEKATQKDVAGIIIQFIEAN